MSTLPVELRVRGKRVLVVGLGPIGRRRATLFQEAGAQVRGVDPSPLVIAEADRPEFEWILEPYRSAHLEGMSLAVAAAPPEVNRQVVADARRRGILVSSASDPTQSDFSFPAIWRSGPVVVSVGTSGASPALAASLRDQLGPQIDPAAVRLAELLLQLRPEVFRRVSNPDTRRAVLATAAHPRWLSLIREQGVDTVRHEILSLLAALEAQRSDPQSHHPLASPLHPQNAQEDDSAPGEGGHPPRRVAASGIGQAVAGEGSRGELSPRES